MAKKPEAPQFVPELPNASIDMNKLLSNDRAGKSGDDMLKDAVLVEPVNRDAVAEADAETAAPADEPAAGAGTAA